MIGCNVVCHARVRGDERALPRSAVLLLSGHDPQGALTMLPHAKSLALTALRRAGAAVVSAGLRRLPAHGLAARRAVRRLLAEAALPRKALVRGDGHAVRARHGRGLPVGRGDRQSAALRAGAGRGRLFRRRAADGAGAEIRRPHRSRAMDGALDGAGRRRTDRRCRCRRAGAAALAALPVAALQPVGRTGTGDRPAVAACRSSRWRSGASSGRASRSGWRSASAQDNVRAAFACRPSTEIAVRGRRVLVVDDVYTTGATVSAVARALKKGGARRVDVLTFARVLPGDFQPDDQTLI